MMEIISLIENTELLNRKDLRTEHGLSQFILSKDQQILFDTGISGNLNTVNSSVIETSFASGDSYHEFNSV
jgi:metal-dependent hydrolase (beta-lactamase superfamily II)